MAVGYAKIWNGSAWVEKPVKYWNGSAWIQKPVKTWGGLFWKTTGAPAVGPSSKLMIAYTTGGNRNDYTGWVGVRIKVGATPIDIKWLAARKHTANTGTRNLQILEWNAATVLGAVTVDLATCADGAFAWGAITPITLAAGGLYTVLVEVTSAQQLWPSGGATTFVASVVEVYAAFRGGATGALTLQSINSQFHGVDLGF